MISLDQILLLEQRVESAVAKIAQLQAENDALRSKCSELTNALSSKSEQLSTFESDQNKIESGILKALDRLNSIENSVLKAAGQVASSNPVTVQNTQTEPEHAQQINPQNTFSTEQTQYSVNNSKHPENIQGQQIFTEPQAQNSINPEAAQFSTMQPVHQEEKIQQEQNPQNSSEQTNSEDENGQFDIF